MIEKQTDTTDARQLIAYTREACLEAALEAYEEASIRGLCAEGAWECAVGAMKSISPETVLETFAVMQLRPGND